MKLHKFISFHENFWHGDYMYYLLITQFSGDNKKKNFPVKPNLNIGTNQKGLEKDPQNIQILWNILNHYENHEKPVHLILKVH